MINEHWEDESLKLDQAKKDFEKTMAAETQNLETKKMEFEYENQLVIKDLEEKKRLLQRLLDSTHPFRDAAKMKADIEVAVFKESIGYLRNKRRPAHTAAEEVRNMKRISAKILRESKEMEYKYEYILSNFPEIAEYVANDNDLIAVSEHLSYLDLENLRDKRKDYLSKEEYNALADAEKSQLALDRYIQNTRKDKWQIGRDYEMSCAFQLKSRGYYVEMNGIKLGKCDLGRDLIAIKNTENAFDRELLIIQCKNWSHDRPIRENVIMQLIGTTIEYQIAHAICKNQKIVPVLMVPPYSVVSDVAIQFAKILNVRIERLPNKEFPRIKCNINNGCKIYHLPFDQQYDRTEIKLNGECYAYTVAEAEAKGFRRAMRHNFINNSI